MNGSSHVKIAKLQAFQAIVVAIVSAAAAVLSTLAGTGYFKDDPIENEHSAAVNAPASSDTVTRYIVNNSPPRVSTNRTKLSISVEECVQKSESALLAFGSSISAVYPDAVYAYYEDKYTIYVACFGKVDSRFLVVAGPDGKANDIKHELKKVLPK